MANEYYTFDNPLTPGTRARSEDINREFGLIEDAFDPLPPDPRDFSSGGAWFAGELAGVANAYTATMPVTRQVNRAGDQIIFLMPQSDTLNNTGAATLRVDMTGSGPVPMVRPDGTPLEAGDLKAGNIHLAVFKTDPQSAWQLTSVPLGIVDQAKAQADRAQAQAAEALSQAQAAAASAGEATTQATAAGNSATGAAASATAAAASAAAAAQSAADAAQSAIDAANSTFNADRITSGELPIVRGGTGASTAAGARTNLGLGTAATADTGTAGGDVPVLGSDGRLSSSVLPSTAGDNTASTLDGASVVATVAANDRFFFLDVSDNPDEINAVTRAGLEALLSLNAGRITSGTLADARIPGLAASKIASGTLADARIPGLNASKITAGTFSADRIPNLSAAKITSGTLGDSRIPSLNASKINAGTFSAGRIPNLPASRITSGTIATARLPVIPVSGGGTGAGTAAGARGNLGLGSAATLNASTGSGGTVPIILNNGKLEASVIPDEFINPRTAGAVRTSDSTPGTSWETGVEASISPRTTSKNIRFEVCIFWDGSLDWRLVRVAGRTVTVLVPEQTADAGSDDEATEPVVGYVVDSPASTASTTYRLQVQRNAAGSRLERGTSIVLSEVD